MKKFLSVSFLPSVRSTDSEKNLDNLQKNPALEYLTSSHLFLVSKINASQEKLSLSPSDEKAKMVHVLFDDNSLKPNQKLVQYFIDQKIKINNFLDWRIYTHNQKKLLKILSKLPNNDWCHVLTRRVLILLIEAQETYEQNNLSLKPLVSIMKINISLLQDKQINDLGKIFSYLDLAKQFQKSPNISKKIIGSLIIMTGFLLTLERFFDSWITSLLLVLGYYFYYDIKNNCQKRKDLYLSKVFKEKF